MENKKTNSETKTRFPAKDVLKLNGYSAIQSCTCDKPWSDSIFLEENILLIVKEGSLKFSYGNATYEVSKNQMAFLKKDILICFEACAPAEKPFNVNYILFSLKYDLVREFVKLAELSIAANEKSLPISITTLDKRLMKYVDSLDFYFIESERVEGNLIKIKLLELLFYLSSQHNKIVEQLLDVRDCFRSNFTTVVEENITNSLSIYQLAILAGRSLSSFRRDFLAIYNMPASQWIRQKRLDKAQQLLRSTTMSVTDICYTTGFENITHFSKLFKAYFRYPPSEFRQQARCEEELSRSLREN